MKFLIEDASRNWRKQKNNFLMILPLFFEHFIRICVFFFARFSFFFLLFSMSYTNFFFIHFIFAISRMWASNAWVYECANIHIAAYSLVPRFFGERKKIFRRIRSSIIRKRKRRCCNSGDLNCLECCFI